MKFPTFTPLLLLASFCSARENYTLPLPTSGTSLLSFIDSHPDLSSLAKAIRLPLGFETVFSQIPKDNFTFFAPSNTAFSSGMSQNLKRFYLTPSAKGRAYLGNTLLNHYVPVNAFSTDSELFGASERRVQTAAFLYVTGQTNAAGEKVLSGGTVKITTADVKDVTGGVVHIVDGWLLPQGSWGRDEYDVSRVKQTLVAGWELPY